MSIKHNKSPSIQWLLFLLIGCVVLRFLSLSLYPLLDSTEARYGEIARIMAETGNWITPMFDYHVPFWGKPPLFAWLSALSFQFLGVNAFAARLPHFLLGVGILGMVYHFAKAYFRNVYMGVFASAILASTCSFLIITGAVMTETALTFSMTLSMISFWFAWQEKESIAQDNQATNSDKTKNRKHGIWGYLFFIGLFLGMLSKGPIILILVAISLLLWLLPHSRWKKVYRVLPWWRGITLFLLLTLPWYVLAELRSPGFLHYFIVDEYFKHFILSGWHGDLYATVHQHVRGMIWAFALIAMLPWTPVLILQWVRVFKDDGDTQESSDGFASYLLFWMLAPMLLFTFSGNILTSYVMPALPAMALLVVYYQANHALPQWVYKVGIFTPIALVLVIGAIHFHLTKKHSEISILSDWKLQSEVHSADLFYLHKRPFSAQFYSNGKAKARSGDVSSWLDKQTNPFFIIQKLKYSTTYPNWSCEERAEEMNEKLLYCQPDAPRPKSDLQPKAPVKEVPPMPTKIE